LNSRRAIRVPGGMVLRLAVNEAWVYEEPVAVLGTGETLNSRHHLAPESYTHHRSRHVAPEFRSSFWPAYASIIVWDDALPILNCINVCYLARMWSGMRRRLSGWTYRLARRRCGQPCLGQGFPGSELHLPLSECIACICRYWNFGRR
jgi:hypothetical protein